MNKRHSYRNTVESLKAKTVISANECWEWQGCKNKYGYGRTMRHPKNIFTHRLMYELYYGLKPGKSVVMHTCDNPPCINPDHLRIGTHTENMQDMTNKGRRVSLGGESNPSAKLTKSKVTEIREMCKKGVYARDIAPMFGISMATVYHIKNGRIWKEAGL